jgi:hypothetical protein
VRIEGHVAVVRDGPEAENIDPDIRRLLFVQTTDRNLVFHLRIGQAHLDEF